MSKSDSPVDAPAEDPGARLRRLVDEFGLSGRKPMAAKRRAVLAEAAGARAVGEGKPAPLLKRGARALGRVLAGFSLREKISRPHVGIGFAPAHLVYLNGIARRRRQSAFRRRIARGETAPVLVAEGDSWFHFPLLLKDVVLQLSRDHLVWSLAKAGDELGLMVHETDGLEDREYLAGLAAHRGHAAALLFSGGGNELIGKDRAGCSQLEGLLRPFEPGRPPDWYLDTPAFRQRLTAIQAAYRRLFADVDAHFPGLPVVFHGYDYPRPYPHGAQDRRRPHWCARDAFLGRAFRALGFAPALLRHEVVRCVIDELNAAQRRLAGGNCPEGLFPNAFHVDLRGLLGDTEWSDEIHPTDAGFARVGDRFRAVLAKALRTA